MGRMVTPGSDRQCLPAFQRPPQWHLFVPGLIWQSGGQEGPLPAMGGFEFIGGFEFMGGLPSEGTRPCQEGLSPGSAVVVVLAGGGR